MLAVILAVVSGLLATTVLADPKHSILVGIIVLLVTLWTNEGLSLGVVSLLPLILFPGFDVLALKSTSGYYANPVIFLFLGGFMLAIAVQKTGLHQFLAQIMMPKNARTAHRIICTGPRCRCTEFIVIQYHHRLAVAAGRDISK